MPKTLVKGLTLGLMMLVSFGATAAVADTLRDVRRAGFVRCGIETMPGFAYQDRQGQWRGFDVAVCRAIAVAALGRADRVRFSDISQERGMRALQDERLDVIARAPQTLLGQISSDTLIAGISYHDGVGIMVPKVLGIQSLGELSGARVCVLDTVHTLMAHRAAAQGLNFRVTRLDSPEDVRDHYEREQCDAAIAPISTLAAVRTTMDAGQHEILPTSFGRFPTGPLVRAGDARWLNIVSGSLDAMVWLEENGFDRDYKDRDKRLSQTIRLQTGATGKALGLSEYWVDKIRRQVGDYGEVFEDTVGRRSALKLRRGLNALWFKDGLQNAPPME